jgi:hypothetical protein
MKRLKHPLAEVVNDKFFAWPVVVPVYLFQTRGLRAFITLLWFAGIWIGAALLGLVVSALRG